jgi:hypothetical protein
VLAASGNDNEPLKRLVIDGRMRPVWVELLKQTRTLPRAFRYPAIPRWELNDVTARQERALASLFFFAVNLAMNAPRVITRSQVETRRRKALDERMAALDQGDVVAAMDHKTKADKWAAVGKSTTRLVVERDTGDAQARCFAISFADQCRQLFGSSLYGVTARVTSVALGRKFSQRTIRGWVSTRSD